MRYKKGIFMVLGTLVIFFTGCGVSDEQSVGDTMAETIQEKVTVQEEQREENSQENQNALIEEQVPYMNVEVSREEKTVEMPLEEVRLGYSCAADETYIYIYISLQTMENREYIGCKLGEKVWKEFRWIFRRGWM